MRRMINCRVIRIFMWFYVYFIVCILLCILYCCFGVINNSNNNNSSWNIGRSGWQSPQCLCRRRNASIRCSSRLFIICTVDCWPRYSVMCECPAKKLTRKKGAPTGRNQAGSWSVLWQWDVGGRESRRLSTSTRYSLVVTAKCGTYAEVPVVNTGCQSIYRQQRAAAP